MLSLVLAIFFAIPTPDDLGYSSIQIWDNGATKLICFPMDLAEEFLQLKLDQPKLLEEIGILKKLSENYSLQLKTQLQMIETLEQKEVALTTQIVELQKKLDKADGPIYKNKTFILTMAASLVIIAGLGIYTFAN